MSRTSAQEGGRALMLAPFAILTLDLASVVGWAEGDSAETTPRFGTWHLPRLGGEGARYAAFENELAMKLSVIRPQQMVLEAHLPLPAMNNVGSARQAFGLRAMAYSEAYRSSIPVFELDAQTARRDIIGQGRFARDTAKQEVLAYCYRRGWRVPDHNAGDACILWEWYRRLRRHESVAAGRLFAS